MTSLCPGEHGNAGTILPCPSPRRDPKLMKLTASIIESLTCKGKTETTYFDDSLPGFGLRCRASGVRRWVVQYESPTSGTKRITIGSPHVFGLDEARRIARTKLAEVRLCAVASSRCVGMVVGRSFEGMQSNQTTKQGGASGR